MEKYIDAHCHYVPCDDIAPVAGFVYNSARPSDWARAVAASHAAGGAGAIGIHPWYVDELTPDLAAQMTTALRDNPALMIGEIGLDRARGNIDTQMPAFLRQLEMARELNRTVHIHCVRAWDVMLNVFATRRQLPPAIIIHGGVPSADIVHAVMQHANAYFSYGAVSGGGVARLRQSTVFWLNQTRRRPPLRVQFYHGRWNKSQTCWGAMCVPWRK